MPTSNHFIFCSSLAFQKRRVHLQNRSKYEMTMVTMRIRMISPVILGQQDCSTIGCCENLWNYFVIGPFPPLVFLWLIVVIACHSGMKTIDSIAHALHSSWIRSAMPAWAALTRIWQVGYKTHGENSKYNTHFMYI